jgi:DNA-binding CsgD family transcriptional regulator
MTETARSIEVPTLVVHVERDRVVPVEEGRYLAGLIPGSRFVQIEGENHMPIGTEPAWKRVLEELRGFLGEGAARRVLPLGDLTGREREVLECIARGFDNAEIAQALSLSEKTVRNHITRVFDKIGAEHRYQAIVMARDAGLGSLSRSA